MSLLYLYLNRAKRLTIPNEIITDQKNSRKKHSILVGDPLGVPEFYSKNHSFEPLNISNPDKGNSDKGCCNSCWGKFKSLFTK
jgi:hypothetical protein